jgi:uncharacterized protein YjbI with pentapeptide repeats
MFDKEHVERLLSGVPAWNAWRAANETIIPKLAEADLSKANLAQANLTNARLHGANLNQANLHSAKLDGARLGEADLSSAKLTEAWMAGADLSDANLRRASMFRAYLVEAKLIGANLAGANLNMAWMSKANFEDANLSGAVLSGNDFDFRGGNLTSANLKRANLSFAKLLHVDLTGADLRGANLSDAQLLHANLQHALLDRAILINTDLRRADLTGASIYGISAWSLQTEGAKQLDLVIRRTETDTPFMLDDLEVAQFIYMMLDNRRLRKVIDTITSKVVLMLGRFGPERKAILDGLRDELRKYNYLPIIFDFEKPNNRDLTETVGLLAHMARFVIADLTDAKSLPQELSVIIPELRSVPIQPIILSGSGEYAMFEHFAAFSSVLPIVEYPDLAVLLGALQEAIIKPAEEKAQAQIAHGSSAKPRIILQPNT